MQLYKFAFIKVYALIKLSGASNSNTGAVTFSIIMATVYINLLAICNAAQMLLHTNKFIGYVDFVCLMLLFAIDYKYSLHTLTWDAPAESDIDLNRNNPIVGYAAVLLYIVLSAWLLLATRHYLAGI